MGQNKQYSSIQAAINGAAAGDTILVYSGTYNERVNVNKRVTLKGVDSGSGLPVVDAGRSGNPFTISANGVWLEGFVIKNSGTGSGAGVYLNSNGNTIVSNTIQSNSYGVRVMRVDGNTIKSNTISNNANYGVYLYYAGNTYIGNNRLTNNAFAVEIENSTGFVVDNNRVVDNTELGIYMHGVSNSVVKNNYVNTMATDCDGIGVRYGTNLTISNNYVGKHYYGIKVYYSSDCLVENNTAVDTGVNIRLDFETHHVTVRNNTVGNGIDSILVNNTAHDNTIEYNTVYNSREGIYVLRSTNNIIRGNVLDNNVYGVRLDKTSGNQLIGNTIKYNDYGVKIYSTSNSQLYFNDFIGNQNVANSYDSSSVWSSPTSVTYRYNGNTFVKRVGNYYSSYSGSDSNLDGLGDTGYVSGSISDSYPLVKLHSNYVSTSNPTPSPAPTATPRPTPTVTPTSIPTITPRPTVAPTATPRPTVAPTPSAYQVDNMRGIATYNGDCKHIENFSILNVSEVEQTVYYKNIGSAADQYDVTIIGLPSTWYRLTMYEDTMVQPGDFRYGELSIWPTSTGTYRFSVQVKSRTHPEVQDTVNYVMYVK